jgi:predicted phage tail protein
MNRQMILTILAIVLGAFLSQPPAVIGQTTTEEMTKKFNETMDAIKAYSVDKKNEAVAHSKKLMSDADGKIKELESGTAISNAQTKEAMQQQLKDIKALRAKAGKQADELGKASAQSWDSAKKGFGDTYAELQKAYAKATATLRK